MPARCSALSERDVRDYVLRECLEPMVQGRVGLEVEWLTLDARDPRRRIPIEQLERAASRTVLPGGGRITFEPGGQIEISSRPLPGVRAAIHAMRRDAGAVRASLVPEGIHLAGTGLDPLRPHTRVRTSPRYAAMEAFFDADGPEGRRMMCGTAAIQINVDAGSGLDLERRWRLAHAIGPVLTAAFANSPVELGAPTGLASTRMANWFAMDPGRTAPALSGLPAAEAWADYALAARVMLIRATADRYEPVPEQLTMREWIAGGHPLGYPTEDDLAYHLTTLFPPVRLRGWLELRMIDALPDRWWPVAAGVAVALLDDPAAARVAEAACAPVRDAWVHACSDALGHDPLAAAADACFGAALDAMPRLGVDAQTIADAAEYRERYVALRRTPGDELLEQMAQPVAAEAP